MMNSARTRPRSPFRPSFGVTPPLVAGRDVIVAEVADALESGPGAAGRASLFTGNRGIGKTVVLNEVEAEARRLGWVVVSETATPGLLDRLTRDELPQLSRLVRQEPPGRRRISGVTLPSGLGGVDFDLPDPERPGGLRAQVNELTDLLDEHGTGLLLTLDEVHARATRDEVAQLCAVVQHAFREERPVAFAAAGLPAAVQGLLTSDVSTFLRRARRFVLEPLSDVAVEEALRVPIEEGGRSIGARDLETLARATHGHPYLVQVMGDLAWRQDPGAPVISARHVEAGIRDAVREAGFALHEPAVNDLSDKDRDFVVAMAEDDGPSAISDLQDRLGRDHGWVSRYRSRLLVAGIVEPAGRGRLRFALPYLAEFVRSHRDRF
jgi:hypothetical protein